MVSLRSLFAFLECALNAGAQLLHAPAPLVEAGGLLSDHHNHLIATSMSGFLQAFRLPRQIASCSCLTINVMYNYWLLNRLEQK
jgi:hypothetical protein